MRIIAFFIILALFPAAAFAEVFKWTDENGTVHYTDNYYKVPEKFRGAGGAGRSSGDTGERPRTGTATGRSASAASTTGMTPGEVYRAFHKALRTEKYDEVKRYMAGAYLSDIQTRWNGRLDEALRAMRSVSERSIMISDEKVGADRATIMVFGRSASHESWADIELVMEGGGWKILKEEWHGG